MNAEQTMSTSWRSPCAEALWRGAQRVCLSVLLYMQQLSLHHSLSLEFQDSSSSWLSGQLARPKMMRNQLRRVLGEVIFPALPGAVAGFTFSAEAAAAEWCEGELPEDADPPAVVIGERLFLETRFAQFFEVTVLSR